MSLVYQAIVQSGPADIRLVVIGGVSIYGDLDLMNKTSHGGALETITVCGTRKALNTATGAFLSYHPPPSSAHAPFSWISGVLDDTLLTYRTHLGSLAGCDE